MSTMFFNNLQDEDEIEVRVDGDLQPPIRIVPGSDIAHAIRQRVHAYGEATKIVLVTSGPVQDNAAIFSSVGGRYSVNLTTLENWCSLPVLVITRAEALARWTRDKLERQHDAGGIEQRSNTVPGQASDVYLGAQLLEQEIG